MWHELVTLLSSLNAFIFEASLLSSLFIWQLCLLSRSIITETFSQTAKFCRSLSAAIALLLFRSALGLKSPKCRLTGLDFIVGSQNILSGHASRDYSSSQSGLNLRVLMEPLLNSKDKNPFKFNNFWSVELFRKLWNDKLCTLPPP